MLNDHLDVTNDRNFGALGPPGQGEAKLLEIDVEISGNLRENVPMCALGRHVELRRSLRPRLDLDGLAWLDPEGGAIDDLPVDEQVTMDDDLARLRDRAGESGAQNERVEAHLKQLDEVFARQTFGAASLLPHAAHLRLADSVLGAKALLLLQTD